MRTVLQHCQIEYDPQHAGILLGLDAKEYGLGSQHAQIPEGVFAAKSDIHVTLLGSRVGRSLRPGLVASIAEQAARRCWQVLLGKDFWLLTNPHPGPGKTVASIIRMVEVPGLVEFIEAVNRQYKLGLPIPPTHITLYLQGGGPGIGLDTDAHCQALRQRKLASIDLPGRISPQHHV